MNRKMRAKLNNEQARRRRDCPNQGKIYLNPEQEVCDGCGANIDPVAVVVIDDRGGPVSPVYPFPKPTLN